MPPQVDEHLVAHVIGACELQGRDVRLASDHECVAFGAERGDDDLGHPDARLRGREERESLVLDLLEAPDRSAPRRVAVGKEAPAPSEPLRVLRVPAEHPHLERALGVAAGVLRIADPLPCRRGEVVDVDAERGQRGDHPRGRRHARGRAERKPDKRSSAEAECQRAERTGGQRRPQYDRPERGEWDRPGGHEAGPAHELRPGDDEDRGGRGEPELGVAPARQQVIVNRKPVGLDDPTQDGGQPGDEEQPDEQVAGQAPPPAPQHVEDDHEREPEKPDERDPPQGVGPSEHSDERLRDVRVVLSCGPCDDGRQPGDDRRDRRAGPRRSFVGCGALVRSPPATRDSRSGSNVRPACPG